MSRRTLLLVSLLLVSSVIAPVALAKPGGVPGKPTGEDKAPGHPGCLPGDALENDDVRIWFHGSKSFVKVFDKVHGGHYQFKSSALYELDSEGTPVAKLNLERAAPQHSTCEVTEDETFVNVTFEVTEEVRAATGGSVGEATVLFKYKFNKSALGAKFDLIVEDWPWAEEATSHELAYDLSVTAGELTLESADNGVGIRNETGTVGFVEWAENATVTYENGTEAEANVTSEATGDEHHLDIRLTFTEVEGGYVHLFMDPWLYVGDYLIVAGHLIGLARFEELLPPALSRPVRGLL